MINRCAMARPAAGSPYSWSFNTRSVDAGYFARSSAGLTGLPTSSPPQFGQIPPNLEVAQSLQNVHSNVQIITSEESTGRSRSQPSQLRHNSSMSTITLVCSGQCSSSRRGAVNMSLNMILKIDRKAAFYAAAPHRTSNWQSQCNLQPGFI